MQEQQSRTGTAEQNRNSRAEQEQQSRTQTAEQNRTRTAEHKTNSRAEQNRNSRAEQEQHNRNSRAEQEQLNRNRNSRAGTAEQNRNMLTRRFTPLLNIFQPKVRNNRGPSPGIRSCVIHSGLCTLGTEVACTIQQTFSQQDDLKFTVEQFSSFRTMASDCTSVIIILDEKLDHISKVETISDFPVMTASDMNLSHLGFIILHAAGSPLNVVEYVERSLRQLGAECLASSEAYGKQQHLQRWLRLSAWPVIVPTVHVIFGTFKGTTEKFANKLGQSLSILGIRNKVQRFSEADPEELLTARFLFVLLPTWKSGAMSPDVEGFEVYIKRKILDRAAFPHVEFAVCAFGSSKHETFCAAGQTMQRYLEDVGCKKILEMCEVDKKDEATFSNWTDKKVFPALQTKLPSTYFNMSSITRPTTSSTGAEDISLVKNSLSETEDISLVKNSLSETGTIVWEVSLEDICEKYPNDATSSSSGPAPLANHLFQTQSHVVTDVRQLCQNPEASDGIFSVHVELKLVPSIRYMTAGDVNIQPENDPDLVQWFFEFCIKENGLTLDSYIHHIPPGANMKRFPTPCTVRTVLQRYCDLNRLPGKSWIQLLTKYIPDAKTRDGLQALLSTERQNIYTTVFDLPKITFKEFLSSVLPSLKLPLFDFMLLCPLQSARSYSIASSAMEFPQRLSIAVALLLEKLPDLNFEPLRALGFPCLPSTRKSDRIYTGVASAYLCQRLVPGATVHGSVAGSAMTPFIAHPSTPLILIAGGTGIGPIRAIWREYAFLRSALRQTTGPIDLYFGCKHADRDWLYRDEILALGRTSTMAASPSNVQDLQCQLQQLQLSAGDSNSSLTMEGLIYPVIRSVHNAFSRDQPHKVYIDTPLLDNGKRILDMMQNEQARIFVCGSSRFVSSVNKALTLVVERHNRVESPPPRFGRIKTIDTLIETWRQSGRLIEEEFG